MYTCACGAVVQCSPVEWEVYGACGMCFVYGPPDRISDRDRASLEHAVAVGNPPALVRRYLEEVQNGDL